MAVNGQIVDQAPAHADGGPRSAFQKIFFQACPPLQWFRLLEASRCITVENVNFSGGYQLAKRAFSRHNKGKAA